MKKSNVCDFFKLVIALLAMLYFSELLGMLFSFIGLPVTSFNYKDYAFFDGIKEVLLFALIYFLYRKTYRSDLEKFRLNKKDFISKVLNLFLIFMGVKIASALVTSIIAVIFNMGIDSSENQNIIELLTKESPIVMFFTTVILAPIIEEGIFRVSFKKVFNNKYMFILFSGLSFGLLHIFPTDLPLSEALLQSISYVTMGFCLGYFYEETNNIWITIGIHMLNNLISILLIVALF